METVKLVQKFSLASALQQGYSGAAHLENNMFITNFYKGATLKGKSVAPLPEILPKAEEFFGGVLSLDKLKKGHRYIFLPHSRKVCYVVLADEKGKAIRNEQGAIDKQELLIDIIKTYEKRAGK